MRFIHERKVNPIKTRPLATLLERANIRIDYTPIRDLTKPVLVPPPFPKPAPRLGNAPLTIS